MLLVFICVYGLLELGFVLVIVWLVYFISLFDLVMFVYWCCLFGNLCFYCCSWFAILWFCWLLVLFECLIVDYGVAC